MGNKEKRWYLGIGQEFVKAQCKEYKTLEGALKAAAKNPDFIVWDENGNAVGSLTDDVPEGALETNPDGSVPAFDADGKPEGTVVPETTAKATEIATEGKKEAEAEKSTPEGEKAKNEAITDAQEGDVVAAGASADGAENGNRAETGKNTPEAGKDADGENASAQGDDVIIPDGEMRVTVVCDGSLNLRRSAEWGNDNICGRATRGQQYHVKAIHTVEGKKMVETIDGLYLSASSAHVQFEQM
nr:MAG: hypothetical protein [Bacteriophage sp.]